MTGCPAVRVGCPKRPPRLPLDANKATFNNSQVLSTATEGHGGTIGITTHKLNSINSVIDASSQSGTDGTVTIKR